MVVLKLLSIDLLELVLSESCQKLVVSLWVLFWLFLMDRFGKNLELSELVAHTLKLSREERVGSLAADFLQAQNVRA